MPSTHHPLQTATDWVDGLELLLENWDHIELVNFGWALPPDADKRVNFNPALTLNWSMSKRWLLQQTNSNKLRYETHNIAAWSPAESWIIRQHGDHTHFRKIELLSDHVSFTDNCKSGRFVFNLPLSITQWQTRLFELKASTGVHADLQTKSLFSLALIELQQLLHLSKHQSCSPSEMAWLKIQDYLSEHYMQEIDRRQIADLISVHPNHLSRLFKRFCNMGFSSYLRKLRMQFACQYLKDSDLNLTQIAQACGLSDATYFIRCFKQLHGCTPGTYRTQKTQKANMLD